MMMFWDFKAWMRNSVVVDFQASSCATPAYRRFTVAVDDPAVLGSTA